MLSDENKLQINTAQSALGEPLTAWNSFSTNIKGSGSTAKINPTHVSMRDPNAYTNPIHMQKEGRIEHVVLGQHAYTSFECLRLSARI